MPIVFAINGWAVVRSEKRGSGPLSVPKLLGEDVEGSGVFRLGGEDIKSVYC